MRVQLSIIVAFALAAAGAEQIALTNGAETCLVDTLGGRVISYSVDGEELLWQNKFPPRANEPWVHGGIPLAWPWFGRIGGGDSDIHGYAWRSAFRIVERSGSRVLLSLDTESALLKCEVELSNGLSLCAETTNKSEFPYPMSMAFHPYFRVGDLDRVFVEGIDGVSLSITNAVDRCVKFDGALPERNYRINDPALGRTICIQAGNSTGVNLWNPGPKVKCPGTIPGDAWRSFVAVEPFAMGTNRFLVLKPGANHILRMKVRNMRLN